MGAYQQQQEMIEQPPVVVHVEQAQGATPLEWAIGVVVPIVVAALGAWAGSRSATYAAWRNSEKGKSFREKLEQEITKRAVAKVKSREK